MENELLRRAQDLYLRARRINQPCATSFLSPAEVKAVEVFLKLKKDDGYIAAGGFDGAERCRLIFLPDYLDAEYLPLDEYITVLRAEYRFGSLSHRDWLGSLMGLGIKRETLGDILVLENHADIICTPQVKRFIMDNLIKVGKAGVSISEISLDEIVVPTPEFKKKSGTVASLRVDAVAALAFSVSRSEAARLIREGRLSVNHLEELCPSAEVSEGTLLSMRGFGRARLFSVGGTSKKDRIFIEIHAYTNTK